MSERSLPGAPGHDSPRFVTEVVPHEHHASPAHRVPLWPAMIAGAISVGLLLFELGPGGFALGLLVAVLPVPVYVMLALWLDRFEAEPPRLLALTFAWGATVAFALALLVNTYAERVVSRIFGPDAATFFGTAIAAPVVEEAAKGMALLLLFHNLEDEFDGVVDGVVYAAMVGLGFAMVENIQFYGLALEQGLDTSLRVFATRGMLSPFAHPFFTAMTGIGLGLAREGHHTHRTVAPLVGVMVAVALHSLWNVASASDEAWWTAYLLVMVPAFFGVLALIYLSLRREGGVIREHLRPLVAEGLVSPEELECLCNVRRRLRASLNAWWNGGRVSWRGRRELHQVASELAFHRWRVGRGLSRGEVADAARDAEYLRRLRELCSQSFRD